MALLTPDLSLVVLVLVRETVVYEYVFAVNDRDANFAATCWDHIDLVLGPERFRVDHCADTLLLLRICLLRFLHYVGLWLLLANTETRHHCAWDLAGLVVL